MSSRHSSQIETAGRPSWKDGVSRDAEHISTMLTGGLWIAIIVYGKHRTTKIIEQKKLLTDIVLFFSLLYVYDNITDITETPRDRKDRIKEYLLYVL